MFNWLRRLLNLGPDRSDAGRKGTGGQAAGSGPERQRPEGNHAARPRHKEPILVRGKYWVDTSEDGWTLPAEPDTPHQSTVKDLIKGLEQVGDRGVRRASAEKLGQMGQKAAPAIGALLIAAIDVDKSVREAATEALSAISPNWHHTPAARSAFPKLVEALSTWSQEDAFILLKRIGPSAAPVLEQALIDGEDTVDKVYMMRLLAQIGPAAAGAVPGLIKALESKHVQARIAAADALAQIGPKAMSAVPALAEGLSDPFPSARRAMAASLARMGPAAEPALPALLPLLADRQAEVREATAEALTQIGPKAVPSLIEVVRAHDVRLLRANLEARMEILRWYTWSEKGVMVTEPYKVWANRFWAAYTILEKHDCLREAQISALGILGRLGPDALAAQPTIVKALHDSSPSIRLAAVRALDQMGAVRQDVLPDLIRMLVDKNEAVREGAARALQNFGARSGHEWAATPTARDALAALAGKLNQPGAIAIQAFTALGPAAVPTLIQVLESGDRVARENAALVLGMIGPGAAAAKPALTRALQDEHLWVQAKAAEALEKIGDQATDQ